MHSQTIWTLPRDFTVNVLEVVNLPEESRVRALIECPTGWISLERTEDGYRWADKQEFSYARLRHLKVDQCVTSPRCSMPCVQQRQCADRSRTNRSAGEQDADLKDLLSGSQDKAARLSKQAIDSINTTADKGELLHRALLGKLGSGGRIREKRGLGLLCVDTELTIQDETELTIQN